MKITLKNHRRLLTDIRIFSERSGSSVVFSSLIFMYLFLPLCLVMQFVIRNNKVRNYFLLAMSLIFYAWGEPKWIVLMLISTFVDYIGGLIVEKYRGQWQAKAGLAASIVVTLSFLAVFKYLGFFNSTVNGIFGTELPIKVFALPIGISFYTFQTITYTVDVYRGKAPVQRSYANLLLYVSLFPQLIAGPIVRYVDIAEQIENRKVTLPGFYKGITRFATGLAKKVILANTAGLLVTKFIGGDLTSASVVGVWVGIIAYTFQIYFDFSGYSDMAIGMGHMLGFKYVENFNYPYISKSITEFWRRWHISLGTFFREYLYIPLGGNRKHHIRNMFIVWAFTGLWHGASWNFVLWGLYYFVFLVLEKKVIGDERMEKIPSVIRHIYSLFVIVVGWALFYFDDMARLGQAFKVMFGFSGQPFLNPTDSLTLTNYVFFFIVAIIACLPVGKVVKVMLGEFSEKGEKEEIIVGVATVLFQVALMFISTASLVGASYNPFLYFRF